MSKLSTLRRRLAALARWRGFVRRGEGVSAWLLLVIGIFVSAFLIDWLFQLDVAQRVILLALVAGGLVWSFRKYVLPAWQAYEDEVSVALAVERHQGLESELVAALQFEDARAATWGSGELRTAVVESVAEATKDIDIQKGFTAGTFYRRGLAVAVCAALIGALAVAFPDHARTFFSRLALAREHYPTETQIVEVAINGQVALPRPESGPSPRSPFGQPVQFRVRGGGRLPVDGVVMLRADGGAEEIAVPLTRNPEKSPNLYQGELPRLMENVRYRVQLGDAFTDPALLEVIPLPAIDVILAPRLPDYAKKFAAADDTPPGSRNIEVIEGSQVALSIKSTKPLKQAAITIGEHEHKLTADDAQRLTWTLPLAGTPLARVVEPIQFTLAIEDQDGLGPEQPIQGFIRLKADRPPRVSGVMITQFILPAARPTLTYGAADDYGLKSVRVLREVLRPMSDETIDSPPLEVSIPAGHPRLVKGSLTLDFSGLELQKGDTVRIILEATDDRGSGDGKTAASEPLILQVTDERGVLAAMAESDERSARHLDAIIQRQLGIGDSQ